MIEARGIIENIGEARKKIESLGGKFLTNYKFKDIIFSEKKDFNLSKDFLRLRVCSKNNWPTKDFVLVRKKTEFKESGKISKNVFKKEFDDEKNSIDYVKKNFPKYKKIIAYSREGWQYQLDKNRIFVEQIEGYKPSMEIESEDESELKRVLDEVNILEILKEPVPEIMRKLK